MNLQPKTLDISNTEELKHKVNDVVISGNPDTWKLICKVSSESEGWMKSTKGMEINNLGVLVQVSTVQRGAGGVYSVAEALTFINGARLFKNIPLNEQDKSDTWYLSY